MSSGKISQKDNQVRQRKSPDLVTTQRISKLHWKELAEQTRRTEQSKRSTGQSIISPHFSHTMESKNVQQAMARLPVQRMRHSNVLLEKQYMSFKD